MSIAGPLRRHYVRYAAKWLIATILLAWGVVLPTEGASIVRGFSKHATPVRIPDLNLLDASGKQVQLKTILGRPVVLNVWATWCNPCVRELPSLDHMQRSLQPDGITVVVVAQDRAPHKVVPSFLEKLKIVSLTSYYDPEGTAVKLLRIPVLPTTLILDAHGREVARVIGALDWSDETVLDAVRAVVRKQSAN